MEASQQAATGPKPAPPGVAAAAGQGQRAFAADVNPPQAANRSFVFDAWGWSKPTLQPVEGKATVAMAQVTAPVWPDTPGQWQSTIVFTQEGPQESRVWNDDGAITLRVFSGDAAAYDPRKIQKSAVEIAANERAKAAQVMGVRGYVG